MGVGKAAPHCGVLACWCQLLLLLLKVGRLTFDSGFPSFGLAFGFGELHHKEGQHNHGSQEGKHGDGLAHFLVVTSWHYTWGDDMGHLVTLEAGSSTLALSKWTTTRQKNRSLRYSNSLCAFYKQTQNTVPLKRAVEQVIMLLGMYSHLQGCPRLHSPQETEAGPEVCSF